MQEIFGTSQCPSPRQRIVGGCLWMKPLRHWYLMREFTSYCSRFLPKVRAFSTRGGWLQATAGTKTNVGTKDFNCASEVTYTNKMFYLCPSCSWTWGDSYMGRRSTGRLHAKSSPHNPPQQWRSCRAGSASSFHIAEASGKKTMMFELDFIMNLMQMFNVLFMVLAKDKCPSARFL